MTVTSPPQQRYVEHVMGMPVSLAMRGLHTDDRAASQAWEACLEVLREADRVFSTYRDDSFVSRLGRGELTVDQCPAEVAEVLAIGERARAESGGAFDVRRPGPDGTLVLDPSGVVKGWAVQRAAAPLLALDDTDVCLSAGGDMVCHVAGPEREPWNVGVAHRGHHVVDPRTGRPPDDIASVTVVAPDLVTADVDATAAYAMGRAGLAWLERRGRAGLVVWADGTAEVYGSPA